LVHLVVVRPAEQAQVVKRGRPPIAPEDEVMPVAPGRRPVAAGKDAVLIPRDQRPARGRRDGARGVREFLLELTQSGDPGDGRIAGMPPYRLRRDSAAPVELAGRRTCSAARAIATACW